ncbi:hypothetical protein PILCRDRAFT_1537 [Piloderma croceum F 1598]|uniref:Exportin-2 central domain-containing protein n=1 Tax=Piloderma croceum (strain F 1598) TaxID=765440 RepID=A0A0C3GHQ7_PILCF|nr:hypothetical protein PILCRDRAFT_1537 [Piloderma croceum F 1598]
MLDFENTKWNNSKTTLEFIHLNLSLHGSSTDATDNVTKCRQAASDVRRRGAGEQRVRERSGGDREDVDGEHECVVYVHPVIQVNAIRFLYTFRNQLTKDQLLFILPLLV